MIIVGIAVINFLLLHLAPGDVVDVLAGESGAARRRIRRRACGQKYGLDQPLARPARRYLWSLA